MNIQQQVLPLLTSARRLTAGASPLLVNTLTAAYLPQCEITVIRSVKQFGNLLVCLGDNHPGFCHII